MEFPFAEDQAGAPAKALGVVGLRLHADAAIAAVRAEDDPDGDEVVRQDQTISRLVRVPSLMAAHPEQHAHRLRHAALPPDHLPLVIRVDFQLDDDLAVPLLPR